MSRPATLGWCGIVRLGLVQAMLGAIVVLTTSTLNRVMVVELALPALLPGLLVALHYAVQMTRPRMGYGSDVGRRRTPWIVGGMAVLAAGGLAGRAGHGLDGHATAGPAWRWRCWPSRWSAWASAPRHLAAGAAGQARGRSAARAGGHHVWLMMIVGFAVTAGRGRQAARPLLAAAPGGGDGGGVAGGAGAWPLLALRGLEGRAAAARRARRRRRRGPTSAPRWREVWAEPEARRFTVFVFVSMLAYSAQDLILEPFAGAVFGFTPGESTQLSGVQHGGVLAGMLLAALAGRRVAGAALRLAARLDGRRLPGVGAGAARPGAGRPVRRRTGRCAPTSSCSALANGAFSIAAIGSMMRLASARAAAAAKACAWACGARRRRSAFGLGGLVGTAASDLARWLLGAPRAGLCRGVPARGAAVHGRRGAGRTHRRRRAAHGADRRRDIRTRHELPGLSDQEARDESVECNASVFDVVVVGGGPAGATAAARPGAAGPFACCCSTAPGASSPAAARFRRG